MPLELNFMPELPAVARGVTNDLMRSIFWVGHVRVIDHSVRATSGMNVKLSIISPQEQVHPFMSQRVGAASGQRFLTRFSTAPELGEPEPVHAGEVVLIWWQHDSNGQHVNLKLDDGPDGEAVNPFQQVRAGRDGGDILAAVFFRIEDDETVARRRRKRFADMSPVQQSQILCRTDPEFQDWIIGIGAMIGIVPGPGETPAESAARIVRVWCGVTSRSELGRPDRGDAVSQWNELLIRFRNRPQS